MMLAGFSSTFVPIAQAQTENGAPSRLKIPSIHVDAAIRTVGLLPDGSMGVPKMAVDTAWYRPGPKPGEEGAAVIDGHVNWFLDWLGLTGGAFAHLNALKPGDLIVVDNDNGGGVFFKVRETHVYDQHADASEIFHSYDGKAHLNLITCDGIWDKVTKAYASRLVVFADKVGE